MTSITLTVISENGAPSASSLTATFDELGGSIGRADSNQLVLPDPDRTVSRVHAQVVYRAGGFLVIDRGSNAISINHRPLGNGREAPLGDGDELQIGGYVLRVKLATAASPAGAVDDPFADLLGPIDSPSPSGRSGVPAALADPLQSFGASPPVAALPKPPTGGIPEDWDPFAPDPATFKGSASGRGSAPRGADSLGLDIGGAAPSALIPDLQAGGSGTESSLDDLFGLKAGSGGDPLANSLLDAPSAKPNMAASDDPLQSLNSVGRATQASTSDAMSDLNLPFVASAAPPVRPPLAPPDNKAPGAVLSWDSEGVEGRTVIRPSARPARTVTLPGMRVVPSKSAEAPSPQALPAASVPSTEVRAAAPSQPSASEALSVFGQPAGKGAAVPAAAPVGADALLAAFREGLAAPEVRIEALTPELMRLVGQLLHEATKGTVDLLVARAALKREVRAESTMIVARENNPLKFSPSVEAALHHLMSPPTRGFMPAAEGMRDAYDDLRAHQFGFIAGMRAALEGVLARFDPATLESQLTAHSMLESLVPGARKARMWGVFVDHFERISNEAADDFHTLFGRAFLKAYEEHIDQLKKEAP